MALLNKKQIETALGCLNVSELTLADLRILDSMFKDKSKTGIESSLRFMPLIYSSIRKVHQDITLEQLEAGLTLGDFNRCLAAMMEVSGIEKAPEGEAQPVKVEPA